MFSGFSLAHSSMVRAFWMLKVSSSKKNSFTHGQYSLALAISAATAVRGPLAPGMSAERLRPQAERALRRAAARGVQRHERIEQERHVVAAGIDVALVDVHHVRQSVEILNRGTVRIVNDLSIRAAIGDAENLAQRLAVGKFHGRVVELAPHDKIDGRAFLERLLRQGRNVRPHERDLQPRDWQPSSRPPARCRPGSPECW